MTQNQVPDGPVGPEGFPKVALRQLTDEPDELLWQATVETELLAHGLDNGDV